MDKKPRAGNNRPSLGKLRTFESFKYPAYRIYYGAMCGSWISASMQAITRSLLIFRLTNSAVSIGIMALATALPALLVSLLGGAVADRVAKKYILVACKSCMVIIQLATALALTFGIIGSGRPDSWMLLILQAGLEGTVNSFMGPANTSIVPELVGEKHIMNALSLSSIGSNIIRLVSPILAGFLIDTYSFSSVYYIMTALYISDTLIASFLPKNIGNRMLKGNTLSNMLDGLIYAKKEKLVLIIIGFALLHTLAGQPYGQLLPVITETILKINATQLGVLSSVSGIGSLLGGFVLASLPNKKRGVLLILSGVIMGVPLIVFSLSQRYYLSLLMMPLIGLGPTMHGAMTSTLIQTYIEPDYRGRIQALSSMTTSLSSLGTFFAGVLTTTIGVQWSLAGLSTVLSIGSIMFLILFPRLRKLD